MNMSAAFIKDQEIPPALPLLAHGLETYAGESNKTASVFREFLRGDLDFRPHARSSTVLEIMKHELLSERRFFAEFLGLGSEPEAAALLPQDLTPEGFWRRN